MLNQSKINKRVSLIETKYYIILVLKKILMFLGLGSRKNASEI